MTIWRRAGWLARDELGSTSNEQGHGSFNELRLQDQRANHLLLGWSKKSVGVASKTVALLFFLSRLALLRMPPAATFPLVVALGPLNEILLLGPGRLD